MTQILLVLFGTSWKSSFFGYLVAIITASIAYAQTQASPGWYVIAFGFAALGRVTKDWDKTNAATPTSTAVKVPPTP